MKQSISLLFIVFSLFISTASAQDLREVKGRVVNGTTNKPLGGVLVSVPEVKGYSTLTEDDGTYTLKVPVTVSALSFSSPDYNLSKMGLGKGSLPSGSIPQPSRLSMTPRPMSMRSIGLQASSSLTQ